MECGGRKLLPWNRVPSTPPYRPDATGPLWVMIAPLDDCGGIDVRGIAEEYMSEGVEVGGAEEPHANTRIWDGNGGKRI